MTTGGGGGGGVGALRTFAWKRQQDDQLDKRKRRVVADFDGSKFRLHRLIFVFLGLGLRRGSIQ